MNGMKKKWLGASLTALVVASLNFSGGVEAADTSDDQVYTLNPVVVTAQRTENKVFDTQANISVISRKELDEKHYTDLGDALKDVPGVNLQNYGASGDNYTSNRLYINGKSNIVVLIDGMRANTNGNASSVLSPSEFSNLDTVERIEVLKGSAATLYGSDAVGGVINIITRRETKPGVKTSIGFAAGSYDKRTYRILNRGYENGYYWMAGYQKNKEGDFKDGHGNKVLQNVDTKTYDLEFGKELGEDSDITFRYNKYKSDYMRPTTGGLDLSKVQRAYGKKDNERYSLQYNQRINGHLKNTFSMYRNNDHLNDNYTRPTSQWKMDMSTRGINDQLTFKDEKNIMVGGFDFYKDILNYSYGLPSYYGDAFSGKKATNRAFYLQDEYSLGGGWNITPGIRYTNSSAGGSKTTKSIILGYDNKKVNVYAGYKEFFKAPSLYQMYSTSVGNPNLKPEKGHTLEAGINYDFGNQLMANFSVNG